MPPEIYERNYKELFEHYQVPLTFLITPDTPEIRIRKIEALTKTFIYLVSASSITGNRKDFSKEQVEGFQYIKSFKLKVPVLVGFGIHNNATFQSVNTYFDGAIIGSAFLRSLKNNQPVSEFIRQIKVG